MLVKTFGSAVFGIDAQIITLEVDVSSGTGFSIVGLPDNAVRESMERMQGAIKNNDFNFPRKRTVVNMAPADIRKEGAAYDLPIALGILAASRQLKADYLSDYLIMGELSLDGTLKPIHGALPIAIQARKAGFKGMIIPSENAREAAIVDDLAVYGFQTITETIDFFNQEQAFEPVKVQTREEFFEQQQTYHVDFAGRKTSSEHWKLPQQVVTTSSL